MKVCYTVELPWLLERPRFTVQVRFGVGVGKLIAIGYVLSCFGAALWLYGYFGPKVSSLTEWYNEPAWMADYLPNLAQFGTLLMLVGVVPLFWPWRLP